VLLLHLAFWPRGWGRGGVRLASRPRKLPRTLWRSLTWDQGKEMRNHERIRITTGLAIYFCGPGQALAAPGTTNENIQTGCCVSTSKGDRPQRPCAWAPRIRCRADESKATQDSAGGRPPSHVLAEDTPCTITVDRCCDDRLKSATCIWSLVTRDGRGAAHAGGTRSATSRALVPQCSPSLFWSSSSCWLDAHELGASANSGSTAGYGY